MSIVLICVTAFLPAFIWGIVSIKNKIPFYLLGLVFFMALITIPICTWIQGFIAAQCSTVKNHIVLTLMQHFLITSFTEESIKYLVLCIFIYLYLQKKYKNQKEQSIYYYIAIFFGLCFGCFETLSYSIRYTNTLFFRIFTTVILHGSLAAFYIPVILRKDGILIVFFAIPVFLHGLYNLFSAMQGFFIYCSFALIYFNISYAYRQLKT
ncbi:MAG: PrsW family glutamic-type intramembrane protease [Treponema sp.]